AEPNAAPHRAARATGRFRWCRAFAAEKGNDARVSLLVRHDAREKVCARSNFFSRGLASRAGVAQHPRRVARCGTARDVQKWSSGPLEVWHPKMKKRTGSSHSEPGPSLHKL